MSSTVSYAIIYSIAASLCYTLVIILGFRTALKEHKRSDVYILAVKQIVRELKAYIKNKEEKDMTLDKGKYKNSRNSESINVNDIDGPYDSLYVSDDKALAGKLFIKKTPKNKLTLSNLLSQEPQPEHYEEIIGYLTELARSTYEDYKFLIAKSPDDTDQGHFLQIVSNYHENPELHKKIFSKAMDYGVNMRTLQKLFAKEVAAGNVLDLGDDVVVITDDGTPQSPTGVSPINSGLEGGEIAFIITFVRKSSYEEWVKNNLNQDEEK